MSEMANFPHFMTRKKATLPFAAPKSDVDTGHKIANTCRFIW
jgi:hypothetical protein